jgi:hypothetical protein
VNCEQARSLLTAYRELKKGEVDTTELDVHLEGCASCRRTLAQMTFVGEQLRALPAIEPPPDMHAQLMRRLAGEHMQMMQKSAPGSTPAPEFLKPYIYEQAQSTHLSHPISAFSTAETGPLPILRAARKPRHRAPMNQFAILGLAAMFLMLLMMGGVTSLVYLAQRNASALSRATDKSADIVQHVDISRAKYDASTVYTHVVSAVANSTTIYDTAYSDNASPQWMLSQIDRATQVSTPLLANPYNQPMIVLASSSDWLVWVQYGTPKSEPYRSVSGKLFHTSVTPWSLYAFSLSQLRASNGLAAPVLLEKGQYNPTTVPTWVTAPVQGVWLTQYALLASTVDVKGVSHLRSYQLNTASKAIETTIATAQSGHILTSPTSNSDGTTIFWSDEWIASDGALRSDIWQQQEVNASNAMIPTHGRWAGHPKPTAQQSLLRNDGQSFSPQIADDTLFWLNTTPLTPASSNSPTPGASPAAIEPQFSPTLVPRTDSNLFTPPLDATIRGQIMMQPLYSDTLISPVTINTAGPAYSLQVGSDFALWQDDKGYEMWDVPSQGDVSIGHVLDNAAFLAVNGGTAVWMLTSSATVGQATNPGSPGTQQGVQIFVFNWPR